MPHVAHAALAASLLAVAVPLAAIGAQTAAAPEVVVMTSSGGVSRGAYQGGVDWTVAEFLRRQRHPAFRRAVLRDDARHFRLGAATGSSAGNVNALFTAIGWCTDSLRLPGAARAVADIAPEQSLYWRAWVNTGFSQLLPPAGRPDPRREPAVLDRTFLETVQLAMLRDQLARITPRDCDVPLGITLTRLGAERVPVRGADATTLIQRVATIVDVTAGDGRIDLRAPRADLHRRRLGVLAQLPELESDDPAGRDRRLEALFDVILASTSFPVAFAPRSICHELDGLVSRTPRVTEPCPAFSDGGIFDNDPFGLAVGLYERGRAGGAADADGLPIAVVYSDPDNLRGRLARERERTSVRREGRGIGALAQLLVGSVDAAREYELQSLLRLDDRDAFLRAANGELRGAARATLLRSSRSAPIVGEQILGFGAFLGRAFREYDFYLGVYDGLELVARRLLCPAPDSASDRACTQRTLDRLLHERAFQLDWLADTVVRWHHRAEREAGRVEPVRVPAVHDGMPVDSLRLVLLAAIHNAFIPLRTGPFERPCVARHDLIRSTICGTRLDQFLGSLGRNDRALAAARRLRDWCNRPAQRDVRRRGECSADDELVDLLEDYRRHLHVLVTRALRHLDEGERRIVASQQGDKDYTWATTLALAQYGSFSYRYRRGLGGTGIEINPSSARVETGSASALLRSVAIGVLVPNYLLFLGGGFPLGDVDAPASDVRARSIALGAGWRPLVVRLAQPFYLAMPLEYSTYAVNVDPEDRHHDLAFGVGLGTHAPPIQLASSLEAGVLWSRHLFNLEPDRALPRRPILNLSMRLLAERFQLSARFNPSLGWTMGVGLSDVNGLLYWATR